MDPEADGYFSCFVAGAKAGETYQFKLADLDDLLSDPASRFQPDGPAGPSMIVDPARHVWAHPDWKGIEPKGQVLYEMHVGTFTAEGTWRSAIDRLPLLQDVGVTCIEVMPINEFNGRFGWGYDGTHPYAPTRLYGEPDDVRAFIDAAHGLGIGVILDVVYNHFGAGDRFQDFSEDYFTDRYWNEWGRSMNFDGRGSDAVRKFFSKNAAYWIDEFRFDGLRLDATQALFDSSEEHVMTLIGREARAAARDRSILLVAENEPQDTRLVRGPEKRGYGLDALWNDDFHHSAMVAMTGRSEAYYHDHRGTAQEFISAAKYGYLFQGQRYDWQDAPRGRPALDIKPWNFVHFLQNHDQIANSGTGARMDRLASPARIRTLTALMLLLPQTPMLFQGQEFGSSSPFFYFADQEGDLVEVVRNGRLDFLTQFPSLKDRKFADVMPVPADIATFERSKLNWTDRQNNDHIVALYRDLLRLRRDHVAFASQPSVKDACLDGSCLSNTALVLRYLTDWTEDERLLIVNFGRDVEVNSFADPLLAPPEEAQWELAWSSEDFAYGGGGIRPFDLQRRWTLPADSALVFSAKTGERRAIPDKPQLEAWQGSISR